MSTAPDYCQKCHLLIAPVGIPWGYAGPICPGHWFDQSKAAPYPLTEVDIRRIVREEIARTTNEAQVTLDSNR